MALPMHLGPYRIDSTGGQYQSNATTTAVNPPPKGITTSQSLYFVSDFSEGTTKADKKPKKKIQPFTIEPWWKRFDKR